MTAQRLGAGPGLHLESPYLNDGLVVAGVDEVGKGSWAGPLVVGVAVLGPKVVNGEFPVGMRDSKALTERVRERVFDGIGAACSSWSTGWASAQECDELGMSEAQRLACERAFGSLGVSVDVAIVDGRWDFVSPLVDEVVMQVKADRECASVAAASVLAKVSRDRHMRELADHHIHWSFASNKGYPCAQHRAGLHAWGPSVEHRTSWAFMDNQVPWSGSARRQRLGDQGSLFSLL